MHQDYLIIITHLGSQIEHLYQALFSNSEVSVNTTPLIYTNPTDLFTLKTRCNQLRQTRIVVDTVSLNHSLQCPAIADLCTFLYYLGNPRLTMTSLVQEQHYDPLRAYDYYAFRLQRMATMAKTTSNAMLLTWQTLDDQHSHQLTEMLHLKNKLYFSVESDDFKAKPATGAIADKACRVYDKYLAKLQAALEETKKEANLGV